ncbi:MAG: histidine phosphatase family protein [Ruminococcus sp.]|nr:histidine phosphatase family protein [Ruminococcus sp.]
MKNIFFTRHGQTVWNVENKICGTTDIELTQKGHEQAKELGRRILEQGIKIDEILYSPLIRAADTAKHIAGITGIPAREELRLKEQCFGKYEATARNGDEFKKAKACFINSYDGGESMLRLAQRVYNLLDELKNDDKVYLLVAHNGISRVIKSYFHDMTNEEYADFGMGNCDILSFEYKE